MKRRLKGCLGVLGGMNHAGLGGAFIALSAGAKEGGSLLGLFLAGWLAGVAVLGLIRLFQVASWASPIVGLLVGPVPLALLTPRDVPKDEWAGAVLLGALFGMVIGLLDCARQAHLRSQADRSEEA